MVSDCVAQLMGSSTHFGSGLLPMILEALSHTFPVQKWSNEEQNASCCDP
jgi:hypothetical protein